VLRKSILNPPFEIRFDRFGFAEARGNGLSDLSTPRILRSSLVRSVYNNARCDMARHVREFMQSREIRERWNVTSRDGKEAASRVLLARHFQFSVCFSKGSTPALRKHSTGHVATLHPPPFVAEFPPETALNRVIQVLKIPSIARSPLHFSPFKFIRCDA